MPFVLQDSRDMSWQQARYDPLELPVPVPRGTREQTRWRGRLPWALGGGFLLTSLAFVVLVKTGARGETSGSNTVSLVGGLPGLIRFDIRPADAEVQRLVDEQKNDVPAMLAMQGWSVDLGPYKALTYCQQPAVPFDYVVKIKFDDSGIPKVAEAGELLQITVNTQLAGKGLPGGLVSAQIVAADDKACLAVALPPPPALPHVLLTATEHEQQLINAVRQDVSPLLLWSGWDSALPAYALEPYRAVSFCGDQWDYNVRVETAASQNNGTLLLQLLIRWEGTPPVYDDLHPVLLSALMVEPLHGRSCAALPVLPPLGSYAVPGARAQALAALSSQRGSGKSTTAAPKRAAAVVVPKVPVVLPKAVSANVTAAVTGANGTLNTTLAATLAQARAMERTAGNSTEEAAERPKEAAKPRDGADAEEAQALNGTTTTTTGFDLAEG